MTKTTQTIEKAFFEVEGIKNVFEGIYLGTSFSYGKEAFFTKDVCLEIIESAPHHNIKFDEAKGTFIESWVEDGKIEILESEKVEVFGTTYYLFGNGWAWEFTYEEKTMLLSMPTKRLEEKLSWLGSFYDIWQRSQSIDDSAIDNLAQVYMEYCNEWGLPQMSCDELICEILSILND